MHICSKCKAVAVNGICPACQRKKFVIEANDDDLVMLTTTDYVSSFLLEDILNDAGVKFLKKGALGSAITVYVGELSESFNFYVLAKDYEKSLDLMPNFELEEEFDQN